MEVIVIYDSEYKNISLPIEYEKRYIKLDEFSDSFIENSRFIILLMHKKESIEGIVSKIRKSDKPEIYLKPVVLVSDEDDNLIKNSVDIFSKLDEFDIKKILPKVDRINYMIKSLSILKESEDKNLLLKVLRYIYTREKKLIPIRTIRSFFGFSYPDIEMFLEGSDSSTFHILDILEERLFISSEFFEKTHFCSNCSCAFLNFIEVCSNCGSSNLSVEDLIHHFLCGFVGKEEEFVHENNELRCPKCRKILKGIGVDFDRPSVIYVCNECGFETQEADVNAICFNCGKVSIPEDLILKDVKIYSITALGKSVAKYGMESLLSKILKEKVDIIEFDIFSKYVEIEIERCKRYKNSSSLLLLEIPEINILYEKLGGRIKELFLEISSIIKNSIRKSDLVSILNENTIYILLTNTSYENAFTVINRILNNLNRLLKDNLGTSLNFKWYVKEINTEVGNLKEVFSTEKDGNY